MKNPLHYIEEYPHRTKQILGITNVQFRDLLAPAEMHHNRIQAEIESKKVRINQIGATISREYCGQPLTTCLSLLCRQIT